jgi:hypothetical protein
MMPSNEMGHTRLIALSASCASAFIMAASLFAAALILNDIHSLQEEIMAGIEDFRVNFKENWHMNLSIKCKIIGHLFYFNS